MVVGGERVNQQVKGGVCEIVVRAKEENQDGGGGGALPARWPEGLSEKVTSE